MTSLMFLALLLLSLACAFYGSRLMVWTGAMLAAMVFFAISAQAPLLVLLPTAIVSTYAYANPVIAVLLGWLILDEAVTVYTLAGAALVVAGVAGIFQNRD